VTDAAQIILDITSAPGKHKAPPDDDEEGLAAAIEETIEMTTTLPPRKRTRPTIRKRKLAEYTDKQSKINAANTGLSADERRN
jgi:hypothetical protein